MKRPLRPDELKVWGLVAGTVHPLPGRAVPKTAAVAAADTAAAPPHLPPQKPHAPKIPRGKLRSGIETIEPNRRHRIARERDPLDARLDLHGLDQDRARSVLQAYLTRAWNEGTRAVLVITGKGVQGDGILRRRAPEWLAEPSLAPIVAGVSEAARHHGGAGALYVALKRKPRA